MPKRLKPEGLCQQGHALEKTFRETPKGIRYCATCRIEATRRWRGQHPEQWTKITHDINTRWQKRRSLKYNHSLSVETWHALLQAQDGKCAICRTSEWGKHGPCVDHIHASGQVRGILCHKCNVGLGMFLDDQIRLNSAMRYLDTHGT